MTDPNATPWPFDQEPARKVDERDIEVMRNKLAGLEAKYAASQFKPVARVAGVHMSRYTIEWTGSPVPEGTELYALQEGKSHE